MKSGYRSLWGLGALMLLLAGCGGNTTVGGSSLDLLSITPSPYSLEIVEEDGAPVAKLGINLTANARIQGGSPGVLFHSAKYEFFTPQGTPVPQLTAAVTPVISGGDTAGEGTCNEILGSISGAPAYVAAQGIGAADNVYSFAIPSCEPMGNFLDYWVQYSGARSGWTAKVTVLATDDLGHEYALSKTLALEVNASVAVVPQPPDPNQPTPPTVYWVSPLPGMPKTGPVDLTVYTSPDASEVEFFYDYGGAGGGPTMVPLGLAEPGALVLNGRYRAWTMTWDSRVSGQNTANILAVADGVEVSSPISLRNNPEFNLAFPGVPKVEYCRGDLEGFIYGLPFVGLPIQNLLGDDDIGMIFRTRVPRGLFRPIEVYVGGPGNWTSGNPDSPIDYGASGVYVGRAQRIDDPHAGHTYPEPYTPYEIYEGEEYYYFGWNSYMLPPVQEDDGLDTYEFFLQVVDNAGIAQSVVVSVAVKNSFLGLICITLEDITTSLSDLVNSGVEIFQPIIDIIGGIIGDIFAPEPPPDVPPDVPPVVP